MGIQDTPKGMTTRKIGIRILISLVILAAYASWRLGFSENEETAPQEQAVPIGSDFTLTNQFGEKVNSSQFRGKYMLVFFGFTHCPDICPTALTTITESMKSLGDGASEVTPVFISVDPTRDTPDVIREYLTAFDTRMVGLTGTQEEVDKVADGYKVYHMLEKQEGQEEYNVAHSGYIYLMDRKGEYLKHFTSDVPEPELTAALKEAFVEE